MKKMENGELNRIEKFSLYLQRVFKYGGKLASDFWIATKIEGVETKLWINIISRMLKGEEVSDREKKFLKEHSKDIIKIIPLVAIKGIPTPIPITAILIILAKKYKIDILPKDNRHFLFTKLELSEELQKTILDKSKKISVSIKLKSGAILNGREIIDSKYLLLKEGEFILSEEIEELIF
jgi:hypothetical protein